MKIHNYDKHSINHRNAFIPEDFRMLVCRETNSGKTNVVMRVAGEPLVHYYKLYLYTNNHHQDKIKDLVDRFNNVSKNVGYNILEVNYPSDTLDTKESLEKERL